MPRFTSSTCALAPALALAASLTSVSCLSSQSPSPPATIWVEAEKPVRSTMTRHPWWYDRVKKDQLSGGDFLSNWSDKLAGEAEYTVTAPSAGEYEFWVRANPVQTRLSYRLNAGPWTPIDVEKGQVGNTNIAEDGKLDLRFIAWAKAGRVALRKGTNSVAFRMDSPNNNHGYLDCFVFSPKPFTPRGILKPDQAAEIASGADSEQGWFPFAPGTDAFNANSAFDLRSLNEKQAGEGGFIAAKGSQFVHSKTGEPVRFWAVNGPPGELKDRESLRRGARMLAKYGVNLVRIHGGYFDERGDVRPDRIAHTQDIVEAMKLEGIYSHFSIYFPLWIQPKADNPYLTGYDGTKHPFAALYFNPDFQKQYRAWWRALLLTPNKETGKRLVDEPAVFGLEIINEDSYFFWTFTDGNIPDPELRILEAEFGAWLKKRYGSLDTVMQRWNGPKLPRDSASEGRMAFRPLWNMSHDKTQRDKDTVRFLLDSQRGFYKETYDFLRGLGYKGLITCSNWATASPEVFGPLEKYSYTVGDFVDRHGYFDDAQKGEAAEWSIRDNHTYADRSALRFEPAEPGKPKQFVHPVMDPSYDNKPSMISETTWTRPNRYRTEAPLTLAAYGALQDSDCIVHFALDGINWSVKPGYFMQPWTIGAPTQLGQFPAAALIYRKGLISPGDLLVNLSIKPSDLLDLKGTPLPQDASFDELRLKDVPVGSATTKSGQINPLVHYAGRTNVNFTENGEPSKIGKLADYIDDDRQVVTSTNRQLTLDYGKGTLTINAPAAQGICGNLGAMGTANLMDLSVNSALDLASIVAVSLDGKALASSKSILLQVMSEEKPTGFKTEPVADGRKRILSIGHDPWLVKEIQGVVRFKRADAAQLKVTALDMNGYPVGEAGNAGAINLKPTVVYYHIHP